MPTGIYLVCCAESDEMAVSIFYIFSSEIPAPRCHVYAPPSHQYRELYHWHPTTSRVWASGNRKCLKANCVSPDATEDCVSLFKLLTAYCRHAGKKRLMFYQLLPWWIVSKTMKDVYLGFYSTEDQIHNETTLYVAFHILSIQWRPFIAQFIIANIL